MSRGVGNPIVYAQAAQAAKNIPPVGQIIIVGGLAFLVGWTIYKVNGAINSAAELLQIQDTAEEKKAKNDVADFETGNDLKLAFTPDYWIGKMDKISTITALTAVKHATTINEAFGKVNDNEEQIYGVFRAIGSKASIAKMATAYFVRFKTDLYQELKARLSVEELVIIISIVKAKKDYTKLVVK